SPASLVKRAAVSCPICAPSVVSLDNCDLTNVVTWDCSGSGTAICTNNCSGCSILCTSPNEFSWSCDCA
ncbi:1697_t:CDS:1, partial [Funneliformis caledonium]